jgi:ribosomal protein L30E
MDIANVKKILEENRAVFGFKEIEKLAKKNQIEEIVMASNCPEEIRTNVSGMKLAMQNSEQTNLELAALFKKPFNVSVVGIKK